jgi:HK97 family phage portal protein
VHIPHYTGNKLDDIEPIPQSKCSILDLEYGYRIQIRGRYFEHDELLHFVHNPDPERPWHGRGHTVSLRGVATQLARARGTAAALMESPAPSIIVKVDGLTEEFASPEGRKKLSEQYLDSSERGRPWFIPAEAFAIEKVAPLNLNDLAIIDSINLDKRAVASIVGVPPFLVGVGDFDQEEYNAFIRFIVLPIARAIEQELTQKLLISPNWYFRFNPRSLYAYSYAEMGEVNCNLVDRAIIDRNEARDSLGYDPRDGLSELAVLENYIPYTKIGEQKKLEQSSKKGDGE